MGKTLVGTMEFNSWFPIANEFAQYGVRLAMRIKDRCCSPKGKTTSKTSLQQYVMLMGGP